VKVALLVGGGVRLQAASVLPPIFKFVARQPELAWWARRWCFALAGFALLGLSSKWGRWIVGVMVSTFLHTLDSSLRSPACARLFVTCSWGLA
jgi:hypothetical protein